MNNADDVIKCLCGSIMTKVSEHIYKCNKCKNRVMRCTCGKLLSQGSGYFITDFKCYDCNIDYDANGHKLTQRVHWGEETGEIFT